MGVLVFAGALILLLSACERKPHPIQVHKPADKVMTCQQIRDELKLLEVKAWRYVPETCRQDCAKKKVKGCVFMTCPWVCFEASKVDQIEINAIRLRYSKLLTKLNKGGCR